MRRILAAPGMLVVCAALGACGTSGSSSSSSGGSSSAAASASTTGAQSGTSTSSGGSAVPGVAAALAFTGGKAGRADPSKSPVTIGYIGNEGGVPSFPEETASAHAALDYINDSLGGVDGHPLKVVFCNITSTDEQAQTCAQQFLNNSSISAVVSGQISIGNGAFFQTLNGQIPYIAGSVGGGPDAVAKNAVVLAGGVLQLPQDITNFIGSAFKPKTVSIVGPSEAIVDLVVKMQTQELQKQGVKVSSALYPPNSTDLLAQFTAANAKNADVLINYGLTPNCPATARTLTELGRTKPVVSINTCVDPTVSKALGDYPKWYYVFPFQNPYDPADSKDVASFVDGLRHYGGANADVGGQAGYGWSAMMTALRVFNKVGAANVSRASVGKAIKNFSAPAFMSPPIKCGTVPGAPAVCGTSSYFYDYKGNNQWTDVTGAHNLAGGG